MSSSLQAAVLAKLLARTTGVNDAYYQACVETGMCLDYFSKKDFLDLRCLLVIMSKAELEKVYSVDSNTPDIYSLLTSHV